MQKVDTGEEGWLGVVLVCAKVSALGGRQWSLELRLTHEPFLP